MAIELAAYLDGVPTGTFRQDDRGAVTFAYDDGATTGTPMSLSMPRGTRRSHASRHATPFLWGLLPDNDQALEAMATKFGTSARSPLGLLRHSGRDVAGALQLLPPGEAPDDGVSGIRGTRIDDEQIASELAEAHRAYAAGSPPTSDAFRFSLAGAQPKLALTLDDEGQWIVPERGVATTHILKPALLDDRNVVLADAADLEPITMAAARALGLTVPETSTWTSPDGSTRALVIERYDRAHDAAGIRRLHQEDLLQALSVHPSKKYQHRDGGPGVGAIADLFRSRLARRDADAVAADFYRALVFNVGVLGTDAHAKNHSLLLDHDTVRLAPLYDLISAAPFAREDTVLHSPMSIDGEYAYTSITIPRLAKEGVRLGLGKIDAEGIAEDLLTRLPSAFEEAAVEHGRSDLAHSSQYAFRRVSPTRFAARHGGERSNPFAAAPSDAPQPRRGRGLGGGQFMRKPRTDSAGSP